MGSEHPYAQRLMSEMVYMLEQGMEIPFTAEDIREGADRAYIAGAAELARRDGHYFLAWLLARYYRELTTTYQRWDE